MPLGDIETQKQMKALVQGLEEISEDPSCYFDYIQSRQTHLKKFLPSINQN